MAQFLECLPSTDKPWVCPSTTYTGHGCTRERETGNSRSSLLGSASGANLDYVKYCL